MRHWNNTGKRGLALFLALLMCLNLLSLSALAANVDPEIPPTTEEGPLETTDGPKSEDPDDPEQSEEENNLEGSEDPAPPADNEEPSSDTPEDGPEDKSPAEEDPGQNDQDEPEEPVAEDPAQDEPEEPVTEAPKKGPAKQKASRTANGWEQDTQTVQGGSSDAVCTEESGALHLTAESDAGSYRGSNTADWPTVFVNSVVTQQLAAVNAGETAFVEMTFTPTSDASKSFGVFLNYENPGNGFVVCYDNQSGWYWQVCSTTGITEDYRGSGVQPTQGTATTLRLEWTDSLLKVVVDKTTLFENVDISPNTGTGFGIKCANGADVTIRSFECGVVEPPAEATISGTVTNGSSLVEGAVVTLENASYMPIAGMTATTDENGTFSFEGVTETDCKVKVQAEGYQVTTVDASAAENIALTVETAGTRVYTNNDGDTSKMGGLTETNAPTFETVDGAVKVTFNGDRTQNNAVVKEFDFINGEISFDATPTGGTTRFGVTLRGTAGNNRIFMGQGATGTWFWNTWTNGSEKYNISQDQTGVPLSVQSGVTRNVRAKIEGSTVSAYLDGIEAYTITLPDGIPTGAGYAGIVANSGDPVVIDNIRVVSFDSEEPATYTLSGTVTGENGAAVSGATVRVGEKSATTDANGAYSIEGLESRNYTVSVSATGYTGKTESVAVSQDTVKNWTLAAVKEFRVVNAAGEAIEAVDGYYTIPAGGMIYREDGKTLAIPMGITSITVSAATAKTGLRVDSYEGLRGLSATDEKEVILLPDGTTSKKVLAGPCGATENDAVYYAVAAEDKVVISGTGAMKDYGYTSGSVQPDTVPWGPAAVASAFRSYTAVKVQEGVTSLGNKVFSGSSKLTSVSLPSTLTKIGSSVFADCVLLEELNIPNSVQKIGTSVFSGCTKLRTVNIPEGLTEIPSRMFSGCWINLESIQLPATVTRISDNAFYGCSELKSIDLSHVTQIDKSAFASCGKLADVKLSEGLKTLGDQAFANAHGLVSITIPAGVNIRNKVFTHAVNLESIVLLGAPASGTSSDAFTRGSTQKPLVIYLCNSDAEGLALLKTKVPTAGDPYDPYSIADLNGGGIDLVSGKETPEKEGYTFQGWLDESGNKVENPDFTSGTYTAQWTEEEPEPEYIAQGECGKVEGTVFYGLTKDGVLHIWGKGEMKDYKQLPGGGNWKKDPAQDARAPWIAYNLAYTSVEIEEGVTSIGNYAFIPNTYAKPAQANLQSVTLPDTLAKIGQYAFSQSNLAGSIKIPDSVTTMGQNAFSQTQITSAVLSQGMTTVPRGTFSGCTNLSDVTIPNGVKTIVDYAFSECSSLTSITFPDTLTTINSSAFEETGLTSVTLPDSVKTLNNTAFWKNPNLESVDLGSVQIIGNQVFQDCPKLTAVELPETLKSLGTAFRSTGIASITVPDGVELKSQAFDQMSALRNIVLLGTPKLAGSNGGSFGWMNTMGENLIIYTNSSTLAEAVGAEAEIGLKFGYKPDVSDIFYYIANLDGGTLTADVAPGQLAPAEKDGFVFQGWTTADGTTLEKGEDGYSAIPAGTPRGTVYTAKWEEPKVFYAVTFNANATFSDIFTPDGTKISGGSTPATYGISTESGAMIETLPTANRNARYAFRGWWTKDGTNGDYGEEFTVNTAVTGEMTVYAKWVEVYTLTFKANRNDVTFENVVVKVDVGESFDVAEINAKIAEAGTAIGYEFVGWQNPNYTSDYFGAENTTLTPSRSMTLNAVWRIIPQEPVFTASNPIRLQFQCPDNCELAPVEFLSEYDANNYFYTLGEITLNDGTNSAVPAKTYPYQCTLNLHVANLVTGYKNLLGAHVLDGDAEASITLYCDNNGRWAEAGNSTSHVVNYIINMKLPTYTVTVDGTEHTVNHGDTLASILPENPTNDGYTFVGWFDGETEVTAETVVNGEMTIEPKWEMNTYTVTIDSIEHTVKHGDKLSTVLPAENPTRVGYTFQGWVDAEGNEVTGDTPITGAMTVTPKWELNSYTVTVGEQKIIVKHGESLGGNMPADPSRSGYEFSGWFTSESGGERITAETPITSDVTLHARWTYVGGGGTWTPSVPAPTPTPPLVEVEDPDVPLAELPLPFEDVADGDWYREAVAFMYKNDLMLGVSDKLFGVSTNTTRGMMATVIYRLEKEPGVAFEKVFNDVDNGKWFSQAITWANANGVAVGYDDNSFGPEDNVTREQLVTMLYRYAAKKGYDVSKQADLSAFVDAGRVSGYAREAMGWAVANGIIQGRGANTLAPTDLALRVEVATIFQRFAARYMTIETTA